MTRRELFTLVLGICAGSRTPRVWFTPVLGPPLRGEDVVVTIRRDFGLVYRPTWTWQPSGVIFIREGHKWTGRER